MIDIEERHLAIVQNILTKYPYSFYIFGSRTTDKAHKFSDLDLCYTEDISAREIIQLETDFEESDLPYKVDIVSWHDANSEFKDLILKNAYCLQASDQLKTIEKMALGHFKYLPKIGDYKVVTQDNINIINGGLGSSMFNIAFGAVNNHLELEKQINQVIHRFQNQPFAWWIPPSERSPILDKALNNKGFVTEATEYAMVCDLAKYTIQNLQSSLKIVQVTDKKVLEDFISIISTYDDSAKDFYNSLSIEAITGNEHMFVAYDGNKPVSIGILYTEEQAAGIFSLLTDESARGKGFGTDFMKYLLNFAQESKIKLVTLSASSDSGYRIYERLGFKTIGQFACYEWR